MLVNSASTSSLMDSARSLGGAVNWRYVRYPLNKRRKLDHRPSADSTVFNTKLNSTLANKVVGVVLPLGLPTSSLPAVFEALSAHSAGALSQVPGINGEIIQAAVEAFSQSFVGSFRGVWITDACFTLAALAGKPSRDPEYAVFQ